MHTQIKTGLLFFTFTLFVCFNLFFVSNTVAQTQDGLAVGSASEDYTFETIEVPGIDF